MEPGVQIRQALKPTAPKIARGPSKLTLGIHGRPARSPDFEGDNNLVLSLGP